MDQNSKAVISRDGKIQNNHKLLDPVMSGEEVNSSNNDYKGDWERRLGNFKPKWKGKVKKIKKFEKLIDFPKTEIQKDKSEDSNILDYRSWIYNWKEKVEISNRIYWLNKTLQNLFNQCQDLPDYMIEDLSKKKVKIYNRRKPISYEGYYGLLEYYDQIKNAIENQDPKFKIRKLLEKALANYRKKVNKDAIDHCKEDMDFLNLACLNCGLLLKKDDGEKVTMAVSCQQSYCNCEECQNNRKRIQQAKIEAKMGKLKTEFGYHFDIGFKPATAEDLNYSEINKRASAFEKALKKLIRSPKNEEYPGFSAIAVIDQNKPKDNPEGKLIRPHVHYFVILAKGVSYKKLQSHIENIEDLFKNTDNAFQKNWIGYRKKTGVYDYFAKRSAGLHGHGKKEDEKSFLWSDMLTYDQWYNKVYRKQKLRSINTSHLRKQIELIRKVEGVPKFCPHCETELNSNNITLKNPDEITEIIEVKPPPDSDNEAKEYEFVSSVYRSYLSRQNLRERS